MIKKGINATTFEFTDDVNSTYAVRDIIQFICSGKMNVTAKAFMDHDSTNFRKTTDAFKNNLEEATDIVLTLGVSLCPFRGKDFVFSIPPSKAAKDPSVKFYIVNPQRNADNIVDILNSIRSINKNIRVFISISPVPLIGSPNGNVVIDDFRSKSSIRMAIDILIGIATSAIWNVT